MRLDGYCALLAGEVTVELWVEDCPGHLRASHVPLTRVDLNSRILVEEITVSDMS